MVDAIRADDCPCDLDLAGKNVLTVEAAQSIARSLVRSIQQVDTVSIAVATGRVLADKLFASAPMPYFDNSAMDGYAVCSSDLPATGPGTLPVNGCSAAGQKGPAALTPGTAMEIYTGAAIPRGADAVVPIEQVSVAEGIAVFDNKPRLRAHIRSRGSNIREGQILLDAGKRLEPRHIGLLAASGKDSVRVVRRPKVAVFSTGDELIPVGGKLCDTGIYDANRPMILALLAEAGCEVMDLGLVADDPDATKTLFSSCSSNCDLIISSGSASVGARDFLKVAFEQAGGTINAWKVAVKPGKPVILGRLKNTAFLGLPGNPLAAWLGFRLFAIPLIEALLGQARSPLRTRSVRLAKRVSHKPGRREYLPVRIVEQSGSAVSIVDPIDDRSSGTLWPVSHADGLAVIEAEASDMEAGEWVTFISFKEGIWS